ncbi:hypothetical protein D0863_10266 [Hortaea werneckii]|uniref:Uncharacterized protein n=1 Tax=Hortaea werneckii TaxID=91943 RepID=A0A3M7DHI4_HORWE|nr:hypothetical protein D0863_10266 [Hortaea werneckii]
MESAIESAVSPREVVTPSKAGSKNRSLSDPPSAQAVTALQPSPTFRESVRQGSKDDHDPAIIGIYTPTQQKTPFSRRPDFARGLSLQMPAPASPSAASGSANGSGWSREQPAPLSPKLDEKEIYMQTAANDLSASPATSLPRHSRGLDFSRACTNLHHSTLAERQPGMGSPGSSPVMTTKGMNIPGRKGSVGSMVLDSPAMGGIGTGWGGLAPERSTVSSSVGSVNMMGSDSESSESDEDASMGGDDQDDAIFTTPQVHKLQNPSAPTPFAGHNPPSWANASSFSPAQASLMKTIRRNKLHKGARKTRTSSSSASGSGYSGMASPRTTSPPPLRSIESAATGHGSAGYFQWATNAARSRRESLALGTEGLNMSSGNDSGDEASSHTGPSTPGIVRRPVVRRGNLLPKTKGFARIRAALLEEAAPVDTDMRRESETIKQVRERDGSVSEFDLTQDPNRPGTATAASSPNLLPAVPESAQEDFGRDLDSETPSNNGKANGLGMMNFALQASRNGGGMEYWNRFDPSMRTPPPPPAFPRQGSSAMSSDINMESPAPGQGGGSTTDVFWRRPRARSSASDASDAFGSTAPPAPVNDDVALKKFKRRREDDFDIATIKRRAVSPGMSSQNSPVLTQSPSQRDDNKGNWGQPPDRAAASTKKEAGGQQTQGPPSESSQPTSSQPQALHNLRSNSGGNVSGNGLASQGKKLGLQGMTDTNDGLMKMSIE